MPTVKRNFKVGNLWDADGAMKIITTNGIIKNNGELTMGAGIALEAAERFPDLPKRAGIEIKTKGIKTYERIYKQNVWLYGFIPIFYPDLQLTIGLFQVKGHFHHSAKLSLIGYSITLLNDFLNRMVDVENIGIAMNFPGIGKGGLPRELVLPLLNELNPLVDIYEIGNFDRRV